MSRHKSQEWISSEDLHWLFFRNEQGMILALSADDSADKSLRLISAGAVVGFPPDMFESESKWKQRLDTENVEYFRAYECQNLVGQFDAARRNWTPSAARVIADSVRQDLVSILRSSPGLVAIGVSLLLDDFEQAIKESKRALDYYGSDETIALYKRLLITVMLLLEKDWPESKAFPIACEFDSHTNWKKAESAYNELKERDWLYAERFGHIGHGNDKKIPALQMADMVAYESRLRTLSWLKKAGDLRKVFNKDSENRSVYYLGIVTKEDLLRFREIEEKTSV